MNNIDIKDIAIAINTCGRRGLNRNQASFYVGVCPTTFDRMILDGLMPTPKRIYKRVLWDQREIDEYFSKLGKSDIRSGWDNLGKGGSNGKN